MKAYLDSLLGTPVQSPSLCLKDLGVGFEQVLPLHPFPARHGAHHDGNINILEGHLRVISGNHICAKIEATKKTLFPREIMNPP